MLPSPEDKRRIIERRIVRELTQYNDQHNDGLPMQVLSAKYSRACQDLGGFPELIASMENARLINVVYSENGARKVSVNTSSRIVTGEKGNSSPDGEPWI